MLLILEFSRLILLECGIGDLETAQGTDTNVHDHQEEESSHETHENACKEVSVMSKDGGRRMNQPGVKYWYSSKRDVDLFDGLEELPEAE